MSPKLSLSSRKRVVLCISTPLRSCGSGRLRADFEMLGEGLCIVGGSDLFGDQGCGHSLGKSLASKLPRAACG